MSNSRLPLWTDVWRTTDLKDLDRIPAKGSGICTCEIFCRGERREVTGRTFKMHMQAKYARLPSTPSSVVTPSPPSSAIHPSSSHSSLRQALDSLVVGPQSPTPYRGPGLLLANLGSSGYPSPGHQSRFGDSNDPFGPLGSPFSPSSSRLPATSPVSPARELHDTYPSISVTQQNAISGASETAGSYTGPSISLDPAHDIEDSDQGTRGYFEGSGVSDDEDTRQEAVEDENEDEEEDEEEEEDVDPLAWLQGEVEEESAFVEEDLPEDIPIEPDTPTEPAAIKDTTSTVPVGVLQDLFSTSDNITIWPEPIPQYLLDLDYAGNKPNPFTQLEIPVSRPPLLETILPALAHSLTGNYNVPRRAVEMCLRVGIVAIRLARRLLFDDIVAKLSTRISPEAMEVLADMNPADKEDCAPRTRDAALNKLQVDLSIIDHPQCPNADCHKVFYEIIRKEQFSNLPITCPNCHFPLWKEGKPEVLHFGRRTLRQECEVIFKNKEVEEAVELAPIRRERRRQEDVEVQEAFLEQYGTSLGYSRVFRYQDDGMAWDKLIGSDGKPFGPLTTINDANIDGLTDRGSIQQDLQPTSSTSTSTTSSNLAAGTTSATDAHDLCMRVNFTLDWANPNSHRSSALSSMGPIALQIADLPTPLRASLASMLLVGVTPGPNEPKHRNVWRFLLPLILELRVAERYGLWIRTAKYPQGRRIRIALACICCDRPAAVSVTGGPNFTSDIGPCLRCMVHVKSLRNTDSHTPRDSHSHGRSVIEQTLALPQKLRDAEAAWQADQRRKGKAKTKGRTTAVNRVWPENQRKLTEASVKQTPGHLSALDLLPYLDKFPSTTFDPMHCLLEGAIRTYVFKVLIQGSYQSKRKRKGDGASVGSGSGQSDVSMNSAKSGTATGVDPIGIGHRLIDEAMIDSSSAQKKSLKSLQKHLERLAGQKGSQKPILLGPDVIRLQEMIRMVVLPSSIDKLHRRFGDALAGTPSADAWRTLADGPGPMLFPVLWAEQRAKYPNSHSRLSPDELGAAMKIFEIVSLGLRSSISDTQVDRLEQLIKAWRETVYTLHEGLVDITNLHALSHMPEDIRNHSSTYNWWNFSAERLNFVLKQVNRSGGSDQEAQIVTYRGALRMREVEFARRNASPTGQAVSEPEDEALQELERIYTRFGKASATATLDKLSVRYAEVDNEVESGFGDFLAGRNPVKLGPSKDGNLDPAMYSLLKDCFVKFGVPFTESAASVSPEMPYLDRRIKVISRLEFDSRRFDSAEYNKPLNLNGTSLEDERLSRSGNSFVEVRPDRMRFSCEDGRVTTGILCLIFQHSVINHDRTTQSPNLFALFRTFSPHDGEDIYGYRGYPCLDIWCWKANILDQAAIVPLNANALDSLRPVALATVPTDPTYADLSDPMWVTRPLHRH